MATLRSILGNKLFDLSSQTGSLNARQTHLFGDPETRTTVDHSLHYPKGPRRERGEGVG